MLGAVGGEHAARRDPLDLLGDQVHVVPGQRGQVVVGEQDPLAAGRVVRPHLLEEPGLGPGLPAHVPPRPGLHRRGQRLGVDPGDAERLHDAVPGDAFGQLGDRQPLEHLLVQRRELPVRPRHDVRRAALVDAQVRHLRPDRRHELHRARAGADDRDALAGEVDVVVPQRGVERRPLEALPAGDVRVRRAGELADRGDEHVDDHRVTAVDLDRPRPGGVVEGGAEHLGVEPAVPAHVVLVRDVPDVVEDRRLPGEPVRPAWVGLERERVERRGHVAGGARVGVLPPHASDVAALLEHHDVVVAAPLELDHRGETAEAGPDDRDRRRAAGGGRAGHSPGSST